MPVLLQQNAEPQYPALLVNQWYRIDYAAAGDNAGGDSTLNVPRIANEWSCGEARGIVDNQTGDWLLWFGGPSKQFRLISSKNRGVSWQLVASDVSNPTGGFGYPNRILGVAQGSDGAVHMLTTDTDGVQETCYVRITLTRSGGHVTNQAIAQTPLVVSDRNSQTNPDPRGDLKVIRIAGNERLAWCTQVYTTASSNTTWVTYAGISSQINPTSTAHFTGLAGSGTDTKIIDRGGNIDYSSHLHQTLIGQNPANEDLYFFGGYLLGDYAQPVSNDDAYDLIALRYVVSGSAFAYSSETLVASNTSHPPYIIGACPDIDRVYLALQHPDNGTSIVYFNSAGSMVSGPSSPLSTVDRAAFGAFSVSNRRIWMAWQTFGSSATGIQGRWGYWDRSSWTLTTDSSPADCNGYGCVQYPFGVIAVRWTGNLPPQDQTAVHVSSISGI